MRARRKASNSAAKPIPLAAKQSTLPRQSCLNLAAVAVIALAVAAGIFVLQHLQGQQSSNSTHTATAAADASSSLPQSRFRIGAQVSRVSWSRTRPNQEFNARSVFLDMPRSPVIFTDVPLVETQWRARREWTPDYFMQRTKKLPLVYTKTNASAPMLVLHFKLT